MSSIVKAVVAATITVVLAAGAAEARNQREIDANIVGSAVGKPLVAVPAPCPGPTCPYDQLAPRPEPAAQGQRTLFLNFDGVTMGWANWPNDDSANNKSWILDVSSLTIPALQKSDLSQASVGDMTRQQIIDWVVDDVRYHMRFYDVRVVTKRPSAGVYTMVVFAAGSTCEEVAGTSCAGIAPLDCSDNVNDNVVWVFPDGMRLSDLSSTASHEGGHSLGLRHTEDPKDIMNPTVRQLAVDTFGAGPVPSSDVSGCEGTSYQDSHQKMEDTIGPAASEITAPTVQITNPSSGDTIGPGSRVEIHTDDESAMDRVEILLNGEVFRDIDRVDQPWAAVLSPLTPEGSLTITARAYDYYGNDAETSITVTFEATASVPCESNAECFANTECIEGSCVAIDGPEPGSLGATCVLSEECESGLCANVNGESRCSRACNAAAPCPSGFECLQETACWPKAPDDGGGCEVAHTRNDGPLAVLLLAFLALCGARVSSRRRR